MKQREADFSWNMPPEGLSAGKPAEANSAAGKILLLIVVLLMCIGVVVVYSSGAGWAQRKFSNPEYFLWRQVFFTVLGIGTVIMFSLVDYHHFKKVSKILLFFSMILLAGLLFFKF
ncbi:MAG: FtsW/RodA/SpoVE family cell cycle protein, partial [Ignavibacteriaceae bacterium]|nr:FtsW/RodA/SpoVE family cell cycle protein [Ignavibacteriaceae bacterium]